MPVVIVTVTHIYENKVLVRRHALLTSEDKMLNHYMSFGTNGIN